MPITVFPNISKYTGVIYQGGMSPYTSVIAGQYAFPPPIPPGPYGALISTIGGLVNFSMPITVTTGKQGLILRIIGMNWDDGVRTITANLDGTIPLTLASSICSPMEQAGLAYLFGVRGVAPGAHTLNITADGLCGIAAIRVGELSIMPASWNTGAVLGVYKNSLEYKIDGIITYNTVTSGVGLVSSQAGWIDGRANPIVTSSGDTAQWVTQQGGVVGAAYRFGSLDGPSGEVRSANQYYQAYFTNGSANRRNPVLLVTELPGCAV